VLKKISQVTAYIALGLIIIVLISGVIIKLSLTTKEIKKKPELESKKPSDPRTDVLYLVKRCIKKETEKALYLAAKQGNTLNISKWKNNGKFIYWFYWNESILLNESGPFSLTEDKNHFYYGVFLEKIPDLDDLSKELSIYLRKKIEDCIKGFQVVRNKYDIFVYYKINNITVTFFNKSVKVKVEMPITIYDPRNNKIDKKTNEFVEDVQIPYKRDYLKLKELFQKVMSEGLYSYYYLFLTGTSNKIPYGIIKYNCESLEIDIEEIKREIKNIINKSHDICYSNCKYIFNPYNSFDSDIKISLPAYFKTITNFYSIKYLDIYLDYEVKDPKNRYFLGSSKVENNKIKIVGQSPEEYYKIDKLEFNIGKICSATVFYDIIINGSLTLVDNSLRKPLVFNIMFDFGLMNNRPITLATYKQKKGSLQWYFINKSSNRYYLWPRKSETVVYNDQRKEISYYLNYELDFELVNINQINDKFIDLKGLNSYSFCYPFFVRKFKNKLPLLTYCSDGSVVLKNKTHFIVLSKEDFKDWRFYDPYEFSPNSVAISGGATISNFKRDLKNNMARKKEYLLSVLFLNKEILEIFNNEKLINDKFYELNQEILARILLSPDIYNPENEKISLILYSNMSNISEIKKEAFILKNNTRFRFSYLYGSMLSFKNTSYLKTRLKNDIGFLNFTNLINYSTEFLPISIFGNKIGFKKLDDNLVFPVLYDYIYLITSRNLSNLNIKLRLIAEFISPSSLLDSYSLNKDFFREYKKSLENGIDINGLKINITEEFGEEIKEYLIKRISQVEKICLEKNKNIVFYSNKDRFFDCLKDYIPEIFAFDLYGILLISNIGLEDNITVLQEKLVPLNKVYEKEFEDLTNNLINCVENNPNANCFEIIKDKENKIGINKEQYNEILSNPLFFMRQKGLVENSTYIKPFFGRDFEYKGRIAVNLDKIEKDIFELKKLLITKVECDTDNGKIEMFYSNYGLDDWSFKTKMPLGNCDYKTKLIYSYNKLKKMRDFKIIIDNKLNSYDNLKEYLKKIADLFNLQYKEADPINEIRSSFFYNCTTITDNFLILTKNNNDLLDFLRSECSYRGVSKIFVLNLGQIFEDNRLSSSETRIYGVFPLFELGNEYKLILKSYLDSLDLIKFEKVTEKTVSNKYSNFNIVLEKEYNNNEIVLKGMIR